MRKVTRLLLGAVVLAISAVLLGIVPFNANFIRGPIETAVRDATGMELSISDRIILRLGPTPSVTSGGLLYGDPAGNPLLVIDSLHASVGLFPLMRGRIHVRELTAQNILVDYCSPLPDVPDDSSKDSAPPSVAVDAVDLNRITLHCGPPAQPDPLRIDIEHVFGAAPAGEAIQLDAEGSVSGIDFTLSATGGDLDRLFAGPDRFPVRVSIESPAAIAEVSGHLDSPAAIDAQFETHLTDVPQLLDAFDVAVPAVGELRAKGNIRSDFRTLELIEVAGKIGETLFAFDAGVDLTGERVHVGATATVERLDLAPFLDNGPSAQRPDRPAATGDIDLRPAMSILGTFDAQVQLSVTKVLGVPLELGGVEIAANLSDGIVVLQSLQADVLDGRVSVTGSLDSTSECPELKLLAHGRQLDLAGLNPWLEPDATLGGHAHAVDLEISSCGHDLVAHRNALRAEIQLAGGHVSFGDEPFPLVADQLTVNIEPGKRSRVRLVGEVANERFQATLAVGSLEGLLGPDTWPIDLSAHGAGGRFQLRGQAAIVSGQPTLDARVELEVPCVGTLQPWSGVSPDATLPLRAAAQLSLDESRLVADAMTLSLGASDLSGGLIWARAANPDTLSLTLRSTYLDLDEINRVFPVAIEPSEQVTTGAVDDESRLAPAVLTLPPVDLDLTIDAVHGNQLDLQELNISGRLRAGLIDDARISVRIEDEVLLHGGLDLDLRHSPPTASLDVAAENVDIGLLMAKLSVADDLRLRADGLELLVTTEGATLAQLLVNTLLEARIRGFYWRIPGDNPEPGDETERAFDLSLTHLSLTAAPDQPSTWTSSGQVDGVSVELWMETPSLIDTFGDTAELPLTLVAAADSDVVMLEGRIDRSADERLVAHVLLSGEVLERENRSLANLESPLADYEIRSNLVLTGNKLELPDLQMQLGSSTANGRFTVTDGGERRRFDIVLHAPHLQTDDLLYWSRDVREEMIDDEEAPRVDDEKTVGETEENRGVLSIARDFIAKLREKSDFDIGVTVDELRAGTDLMGGGEIRLFVDEDDFNLKPLSISLPGGGVNAEYTASTRDGRLDAGLKVQADALSYGGLLRLADPESEARGLLFLDIDISANTEWSPGAVPFDLLFANADGSIDFAAWPENIEAGVLDLWSANVVLAVLPRPEAGKVSRLNCVATRFDIEDGMMQSQVTLLDTTDTVIRGRGTIDFSNDELDLLVWPQAKREKFLSASTPVKVTGTFDDFQIGVEPAGFIGTMIKWYTNLIYVPFKWLTGERFPPDGTATCFDAMDWELSPELHNYFLQRDFSAPPSIP